MRLMPGSRLTAVAAAILLAIGTARYLTIEPAPTISIRWREDVTAARRAELERSFLLVATEQQGTTFRYDLLDTRRSNLEALLKERDVADTAGIDRNTLSFAADYLYGSSWMWVAHRTPLLRIPGVVEALVGVCMFVLAAGLVRAIRMRPWSAHR
jgi:hypothetical protein